MVRPIAICVAVMAALCTLDTGARGSESRLALREGRFPIYAYSPESKIDDPGARPMTIYLHGMCGDPANGCSYFREGVAPSSWLLCPSAKTLCPGGGAIWSGSTAERGAVVDEAERQLVATYGDAVDGTRERVLIGFSQGAYLARNLIAQRPSRYRSVMFIGADVQPTAEALRAAGVRRAVFASGRFDGTRRPLERAAEALVQEGYPARFVDLGPVGHTYVPARDEAPMRAMREALAWLEGA
ncbi:hypothetical protein LVJ94_00495 [Pendulispora rubella]|uniref:Phospholipase/carboxylesterase/thioesterase domain-containing protein n=1 Tax=Pendulispora rubella TaxID=2741070 RepID=A0ABZ2L727_9BACT